MLSTAALVITGKDAPADPSLSVELGPSVELGDANTRGTTSSEPSLSDFPEPAEVNAEAAGNAQQTSIGAEQDGTVTGSDAATATEPAAAAGPTGDSDSPVSRRERRLAEVQNSTGPVQPNTDSVQPTNNPPAAAASAAATVPRRKRKGPIAFLRGLFFLLVISALVVGIGTVISGHEEVAARPSQTELHRQQAWKTTTTLATYAAALSTSTVPAKTQQLLQRTAKDLSVQSAALGDGLPPSTAEATAPATATSTPPSTVAELQHALSANAEALLDHALTADHAMGRVFAAVGTSQLFQAQDLAAASGNALPTSKFLPAKVDFSTPAGPECSSTLEPRPGATIDAALRAAAVGEQRASYAYQVSTTRMAEPKFSESAELLARHQDKLVVLNKELELRCLPKVTPVPGFALDSAFTAHPETALAGLERELEGIYADLAALSAPRSRDAAPIPAAATVPAAALAPPSTTKPSMAPATALAANGTLREISVRWLLDSAQTQQFWGGTVGALAGITN